MDTRKLLVILGITGNQGGSVARTFLSNPDLRSRYRLRGITRDPDSPASTALSEQGVDIFKADLHDPTSLTRAFKGANVIFSVTDFWSLYFSPANLTIAAETGKPIGQIAYELEYEQGRNIADAAAAVVPNLERFVVSMLSSPRKWSGGRYRELWHYESKADMIEYIRASYPELEGKMSEVNMGVFFHSWRIVDLIGPREGEDGVWVLKLPCKGERPAPLVDPRRDTGPFVRALLELEPGVQVYGETWLRSWREWLEVWGRVKGKKTRYEEVSVEWYEKTLVERGLPKGFGTEIAEMFEFMELYGYDGGDPACKRKEELAVDIPGLSNVEDYIKATEWPAASA